MDKVWYVAVDGVPDGPHERESLEHLRATGKVEADTLVWREGMSGWAPYVKSGLNAPLPPPVPPPIPVRPVDERAGTATDEVLIMVTPSRGKYGFDDVRGGTPSGITPAPPEQAVDDDGWQSTEPAPWRRYFARMFDLVITGSLVWMVLGIVLAALSTDSYQIFFGPGGLANNTVLSAILTCVILAPIEALMLGYTGTTVGKWIFGIRITDRNGFAIGFSRAVQREASALLRGLGLGVPLISMVTMIVAYNTLTKNGSTTWDAAEPWVVTYRRSGAGQIALSIVGVVVLVIVLGVLQAITHSKI